MTEEWDNQPFTECIESVRVDRAKQIKMRQYQSEGKYPIVDQGQGLVAGWTDNEVAVIRDGLPYVVFGDHTRIFKYVDFPFALGADGTKLIKPKDDISPLYFYFHLLVLDIPSRGYSRHYRLLKEKEISLPPIPQQKKISAVLLKIQRAIETQEKIIQSLRDLKKSTMQHLFTRGLRGEKTNMTEIGEIPESWEVVPLGSCCEFLSGGTPRKSRADFWGGPIPWASPKDMKQERLSDTQDHITEAGLKDGSTLAPARSLFVVVRGMVLAKDIPVSLAEVPMAFNQDMKAVIAGDDIGAKYLLYAMQAFKHLLFQNVGRSAHGTRTILSSTLSGFRIPRPRPPEQRQIANDLSVLEEKVIVHLSKRVALQDLFKTTLNKLMTGVIRVGDLDIDVSEVEG